MKVDIQKNLLSKIATGDGHAEESAYFGGWKAYNNDPFNSKNNPLGVIQMGLAQNQVTTYMYQHHSLISYVRFGGHHTGGFHPKTNWLSYPSENPNRFTSILEEEIWVRGLQHLVYSHSKDMGFPGFWVGIVYSYNDACARKLSSFGLVSSQTQHMIASMLSHRNFIHKYLSESKRIQVLHRGTSTGGSKF